MSLPTAKIDRQTTTPFLLRLFYRSGNFHRLLPALRTKHSNISLNAPLTLPGNRLDEFASSRLPPHLQIYTWPNATLSELTHLLLTALPSLLPSSYAGTRIAFRLILADTHGASRPGAPPRYTSRDLGSVIVGAQAIDPDTKDKDKDVDMEEGGEGAGDAASVKDALKQLKGELEKTLSDARFVIGDYISAAILPPLADGSVPAAPSAPSGPSSRGPPLRDSYGGPRGGRENGFGGRGGDFGYGGRGGRGRFDDRRGGGVPSGEWRRGEAPPDREGGYWRGGGDRGGAGPGGGRGRGRGRW